MLRKSSLLVKLLGCALFFILICIFSKFQSLDTVRNSLFLHSKIHKVAAPANFQIIQRDINNQASVCIVGQLGLFSNYVEAAIVPYSSNYCQESDFIYKGEISMLKSFEINAKVRVGYYRLFLRSKDNKGNPRLMQPMEFGVGDVFIVAGQSNALGASRTLFCSKANGNSSAQFVNDNLVWNKNNDPQTAFGGGSVWPMVGDSLIQMDGVPRGFAVVAKGGTDISYWLKSDNALLNCVSILKKNGFKAILWVQGESDCFKNNTNSYYQNLKHVIVNSETTWIVATSSCVNFKIDTSIRMAQKKIITQKIAMEGPDIDSLRRNYREVDGTHLNELGTKILAQKWVNKLERINLKN